MIRIIPFRRESAAWNLALEEALFLKAKEKLNKGQEVPTIIKTYSFSKPSVVLGHRQILEEVDHEYIDNQGLNLTMRTTGGGSVYLGKNDVQYSIITTEPYSKEFLKKINSQIVEALQDAGFPAALIKKNNHDIVRVKGKGTIFDAQRRYKNLTLHHGTTLVDNFDYDHMNAALKATKQEKKILEEGNLWLRQLKQIKEKQLIKNFEKNFSQEEKIIKKDYTEDELKLAKQLYKTYYSNRKKWSDGKKKHGICYLTDTDYDMDLYAEVENETRND